MLNDIIMDQMAITTPNPQGRLFLKIKGGFFWRFLFFTYFIQHYFICRLSDFTVPTDAGIEPKTVATAALAVRRSIRN
jgi:hypothetical protein